MAAVLKPFAFTADGYTVEHLNEGDDREFGAFTDGLVEAGLISADVSVAEASVDGDAAEGAAGEGESAADDQDPESKKRGK